MKSIRKFRHYFAFIWLIAILGGCALGGASQSYPPVAIKRHPLEFVIQPELNVETTAELGNTLISTKFVERIPTIILTTGLSHSVQHNGIDISINVPGGELTEWAEGQLGTYYVSSDFFAIANTLIGSTRLADAGGVVIPKDNTPAKYAFRRPQGYDYHLISESPVQIEYKKGSDKIIPHRESFAKELIYTGITKNTISILYREFSNDLIRPAFTQELKYDLSEGAVIGFKGARFQVIKATNTEIKYKVLRHL